MRATEEGNPNFHILDCGGYGRQKLKIKTVKLSAWVVDYFSTSLSPVEELSC